MRSLPGLSVTLPNVEKTTDFSDGFLIGRHGTARQTVLRLWENVVQRILRQAHRKRLFTSLKSGRRAQHPREDYLLLAAAFTLTIAVTLVASLAT